MLLSFARLCPADGRRYLTGDRFTAADLTFAALAAPAVGQPYGTAPGLGPDMPPTMRAQVRAGHPPLSLPSILRCMQGRRIVMLSCHVILAHLPHSLQSTQVEALRGHPAGQFALRLWAAERDVVLRGPDGPVAGAAARY